jgi:hypothetical protein
MVLVGQKKALYITVRGQQTRRRWSKLKEWLDHADDSGRPRQAGCNRV